MILGDQLVYSDSLMIQLCLFVRVLLLESGHLLSKVIYLLQGGLLVVLSSRLLGGCHDHFQLILQFDHSATIHLVPSSPLELHLQIFYFF